MTDKTINQIDHVAFSANNSDNMALQTSINITKKITVENLSGKIIDDMTSSVNTFEQPQNYSETANSNIDDSITSLDVPTVRWVYDKATSLGYVHTLSGFAISNNATYPNTHIDIGAGIASTSTFIRYAKQTSSFTKRIDQTFVVGTGNGGMAPGESLTPDTWYHFFIIMNDTTLAIEFVFDTSVTCSHIPAGYDSYARIGSVLTDSDSFVKRFSFYEYGGIRSFRWYSPIINRSSGLTQSLNIVTVSSPSDIKSIVDLNISLDLSEEDDKEILLYIFNSDVEDLYPHQYLTPLGQVRGVYSKSNAYAVNPLTQVRTETNSDGEIMVRSWDATGGHLSICTLGWIDQGNKFF